MTLMDSWPFGAATHHPAAVVKYWGAPPRAKLSLKPIVTPGHQCCDDGHPPDCWRNILLPPVADQSEPGSSCVRDLLAQAVVLRNAGIMRERPSDGCWHLRGYEVQQGDVSVGYLHPDLSPSSHEDLSRPFHHGLPFVALSIQSRHRLLRSCVAIGLAADGDDIDLIHDRVAQAAPEASGTDRLAGLILAVVVSDMGRGFDLYRSYGHALNATYPWLKEHGSLNALVPVLDATVLLQSPRETAQDGVVGDLAGILQRLHRPDEQGSA